MKVEGIVTFRAGPFSAGVARVGMRDPPGPGMEFSFNSALGRQRRVRVTDDRCRSNRQCAEGGGLGKQGNHPTRKEETAGGGGGQTVVRAAPHAAVNPSPPIA